MTPVQAVGGIASGHRVFIGTGPAEPESLVQAMTAKAAALRDVHVVHCLTMGTAPYAAPGMAGSFQVTTLFIAPNVREAVVGRPGRLRARVPERERRGSSPTAIGRTGRWSS